MTSSLKLFSYNCRGLKDQFKRCDIFNLLKEKNADIVCLQETHFVLSIEKNVYSNWEGDCYYSHGESNARGVAILVRKGLDVKVNNIHTDTNGCMVILDLTFDGLPFSLVNIYGPNKDCPEFFKTIFNTIDTFCSNNSYIICGDFNLVLDPE